jgi:hypothetical protein
MLGLNVTGYVGLIDSNLKNYMPLVPNLPVLLNIYAEVLISRKKAMGCFSKWVEKGSYLVLRCKCNNFLGPLPGG